MSAPQPFDGQVLYIKHLEIQREHLIVMLDWHHMRIRNGKDQEIIELHREIAEAIEQTVHRYDKLLDALQGPVDKA